MNPEGIVVYGDQILVANSGWEYDNTVTVIDVATFDSIASITVEWNPQQFVVVGDSIYLLAKGQYDENWNCDYPVQSINVAERTARTITNASHAVAYDGVLYLCNSVTDWNTFETTNTFFTYDVEADTLSNASFLQGDTEEVASNSVYMMEVNPKNGEIYIGLSGNKFVSSGMVHRYGPDGVLIHRFDVQGANPNQAAFVER
jgi:YVTN family beta-propeller protein